MNQEEGRDRLKQKIGRIYDEKKRLEDQIIDLQTQIQVLDLELDKLIVLYQYNETKGEQNNGSDRNKQSITERIRQYRENTKRSTKTKK